MIKKFLLVYLLSITTALAGLPPTSTKINGESTYSTTFKTDFGSFTGTRSGSALTLTGIGAASGTSLALGGALNASAVLDVQSTTKAFLPPRMTDVQMKAIPSPTAGMMVFNTDYNIPASYNGTTWNYHFSKLQGDDVYSAQVSSAGVVSGENTDFINGNCTSANPFVCTFVVGRFSTTPNCTATFAQNVLGSSYPSVQITAQSAASISIGTSESPSGSVQRPFVITCQKAGSDYAATAASAVLQSNANYGDTPYTPTWTGIGTPSAVSCFHSRNADKLKIRCKATTGSSFAASAMSVTLPGTLQIDTSKISATAMYVGSMARSASNHSDYYTVLAFGSAPSLLYFSRSTSGAFNASDGSALFAGSEALSFYAEVPIAGWTASPFIVGSFEGIEKCANAIECQDVFSAQLSTTGVVSGENQDFINGNCSSASSTLTCTFNSNIFTVAPNCWVNVTGSTSNARGVSAYSTSATNAIFWEWATQNGTPTLDNPMVIACQKQGVDSKPKTAKIASSIGVPTVPGIVGNSAGERIDTFTVTYGGSATTACSTSPCPYLDQIGSAVTSITRGGTSNYTLNTAKTYTKLKCVVNATAPGVGYGMGDFSMSCANCNNAPFYPIIFTTGPASQNSLGTLYCQGSY